MGVNSYSISLIQTPHQFVPKCFEEGVTLEFDKIDIKIIFLQSQFMVTGDQAISRIQRT